jgi:tetratricopeptide (TPR) repeat protein
MAIKSEQEISAGAKDYLKRAKTGLDSKNWDGAIAYLLMTIKAEPMFLEGRKLLRRAQFQKIKLQGSGFNQGVASVKASALAMKAGGAIKQNPIEALTILEEAFAADPTNTKANELLAEAGLAMNEPEFAVFAYESIYEGDQKNTKNLHRLAKLLMEIKAPGRAQSIYQKIGEIDPTDSDAISASKNAAAAQASQQGGWESAKDYRDLMKNKDQAVALEQANKVQKSEDATAAQIQEIYAKYEKDPKNIVYPKQMAGLYANISDYENAIAWYNYAWELGNKADSNLEKLISDLTSKQYENCIKQAKEYLEQVKANPELQDQIPAYETQLADLQKQKQDYVLQTAKDRVQRYPNENQYHFEYGEALFNCAQYKEAIPELQLGAKQPTVRYKALNYIGLCHWKRTPKMLDMASKTLQGALSEIPTMDDAKKEITYNHAQILEEMKKNSEAIELYKQIYEVDMAYKDVAEKVEKSYETAAE